MFAAFGVASPFLPALLHERGLGPSQISAVSNLFGHSFNGANLGRDLGGNGTVPTPAHVIAALGPLVRAVPSC